MQRILFWTTCSVAVALAAVTTTQLLGQAAQEGGQHEREHERPTLPATLPGPIVSTHELMELFNQPLYEFLQQEMQRELGENTKWQTIADRGLQAAEVMNLVAIRERAEGQREAWMRHAREVQQAGLTMAQAAQQHDVQETRNAYQAVIRGCNSCHQSFAPEHAPQLEP